MFNGMACPRAAKLIQPCWLMLIHYGCYGLLCIPSNIDLGNASLKITSLNAFFIMLPSYSKSSQFLTELFQQWKFSCVPSNKVVTSLEMCLVDQITECLILFCSDQFNLTQHIWLVTTTLGSKDLDFQVPPSCQACVLGSSYVPHLYPSLSLDSWQSSFTGLLSFSSFSQSKFLSLRSKQSSQTL